MTVLLDVVFGLWSCLPKITWVMTCSEIDLQSLSLSLLLFP